MCNTKFYPRYCCELIVKSSRRLNIKLWMLAIPIDFIFVGLPIKIRRFTLLRSPLGNKKSKDQFELKEYGVCFKIITNNISFILYLLEIVQSSSGIKLKIKISHI